MSIENPTLAHFRHFSSLLTNFPSTLVESALQNHLFMQNKANFRKSQMNVNSCFTMKYEQRTMNYEIKTNPNEPKTNPILANKTPIRTQFKPKQIQFQPLIMASADAIFFVLFGVLLLTCRHKSRKVPALYFPVVLFRLFEGIGKCRNRRPIRV